MHPASASAPHETAFPSGSSYSEVVRVNRSANTVAQEERPVLIALGGFDYRAWQRDPALNKSAAADLTRQADGYLDQEDYERAVKYYTLALERDNKFGPAYYNRAQANQFRSKYDFAIADFAKAASCDVFYQNEATRKLADLLQRLHRYKDAIAPYSKLIKMAPTDGLYVERANCYKKLGQNDLALADLQAAKKKNSRASYVRAQLASLLFTMKRYDEALTECNECIARDPYGNTARDANASIYKIQAQIYEMQHKPALAEKAKKMAAEADNDNLLIAPFSTK